MKKSTGPVLTVGSSTQNADLRYRSGFATLDPVVFLMSGSAGYLVVPAMEKGRAQHDAIRGISVLTPLDLGIPKPRRRRLSAWVLALLKRLHCRHVTVSPSFPLGVAQALKRSGVRLSVAQGPLFPERSVKTPVEIACIRQSQRAAVAAMKSAVDAISASRIDRHGFLRTGSRRLTVERVRRIIAHELLEHDCFAGDIIVACGKQSADPHESGHGALRSGQPIVIDIFPQHMRHGYWGDLTRTVVRGEAPAQLRSMFKAVQAAQKAALRVVRHGVSGTRVHAAAKRVLAQRGFVTRMDGRAVEGFIHGTGHGVGLAIHELPSLSPGGERLAAGNVVTVEPGLYYRSLGGVRIEDTVVVTRRGWKPLVTCRIQLEI